MAATTSTDSETRRYELSDRYRRDEGTAFLTGVQALARIPIEQLRRDRAAGLNTAAFLSGYPGSPLGTFDQEVARSITTVPDLPIVHQPAVNEELGATSVMGSQLAQGRPDATYDGVVGIWYGKAPGLDRAGDALRHGVFAGSSSRGGAVVLVGDDPGCKSSTMPSSSDASLVDFHMPVLYPGTMAECVELGLHAVAMSRASGLWSAMKIVTPVADGSGTITFPVLDADPVMPTVEVNGERWASHPSAQFLGTRMIEVEQEFREIRLPLAQRYGIENQLNRMTADPSDAWIGFVATGFTYFEMLEAFRRLGLDGVAAIESAGIRLLQLRMPVPFNPELIRAFAEGLDEIVVVEEKNPTLEWLIKDALYNRGHHPQVLGKIDEDGNTLMRSWGQLDADAIVAGLRSRLHARVGDRLTPEPAPAREKTLIPLAVNRTPFFCSGCPHNWGTKVPDGALVGAGTGCHGMILLMDEDRVGESIGVTAMGNEGAQWVGMEPFVESTHLFQNYGDGTFFHSGQLALQYCVGAKKNITFKILYNGTVAMTGGQDSVSPIEVPELVTILLAHGVSKVAITTEDPSRYRGVDLTPGVKVHDRTDIVAVQEELRAVPGVTVLIHDQFCAAELRRARKRGKKTTPTQRVVINHRICEGCGDCGDVSNCLSVQPVDTPLGRKTTIDQASCNFDMSCLQGDCPAFMTVDVGESGGPVHIAGSALAMPADELPDPTFAHADARGDDAAADLVRIRLAGIGGTGVVTVAQILSTAAMLDGWEVRGLDQTGLSQKAGPVVSDVVLARGGRTSSNLVGHGQADVLLGFDGLVAASDNSISATDRSRTVAVVSHHRTPTGRMISEPATTYPEREIVDRLGSATRSADNRFLDATALAESLTGGAAQANLLLLGVAVQDGRIPVSVAAIEEAIELNGVAVEANLAAFEWGRRWARDPSAVEMLAARAAHGAVTDMVTVAALPSDLAARIASIVRRFEASDVDTDADLDLGSLLTMLAGDLIGYQDITYAGSFVDDVEAAADVEQRVGSTTGEYVETVARSMHKLMAYKDEYEVARLMLLPEASRTAAEVGGPGAAVAWKLHPPMLKMLGLHKKLSFSTKTSVAFTALRAGKRLRGTRLDPFGRSEMRRTEAALAAELRRSLAIIGSVVTADTLGRAVAAAGLPDMIRGYEDLKVRRIDAYRAAMAEALDAVTRT